MRCFKTAPDDNRLRCVVLATHVRITFAKNPEARKYDYYCEGHAPFDAIPLSLVEEESHA